MTAWKVVQFAVWLVGVAIVGLLLFAPELGLHAFWNVLIPAAPALVVLAPGVWRNVCPMAITALFARKLPGAAERRRLSVAANDRLVVLAVVLLLLIIPLRHVVLDLNGPATAMMLLVATACAVGLGLRFEWKSGWCSGLCPIHVVEKLYGSRPLVTPRNAHCQPCERCVDPCADSTPAMDVLTTRPDSRLRRLTGLLLLGLFPGFIAGWFLVPDYAGGEGWAHLGQAYGTPYLWGALSLALFGMARATFGPRARPVLERGFAAAAVSCYYWFRLPALFGFGAIPGDGMLVDLTASLPVGWVVVSRVLTTGFFFWWMLRRRPEPPPWSRRPAYANPPVEMEGFASNFPSL